MMCLQERILRTRTTQISGITYEKGSTIIRMLMSTLGAEVFRNGMQRYLEEYKFGNADHVDYFNAMTEVGKISQNHRLGS